MEDISKEKTTEEKIEEIKDEIEELYPNTRKWPSIVFSCVDIGILIISVVFIIYATAIHPIATVQLVLGIVFGAITLILMPFALMSLSNVSKFIKKHDTLRTKLNNLYREKQKQDNKYTSTTDKEILVKEESNEDTLLRLLSEGKISVEEYKKLSKKE